jgi:5-methylthioadenosine/S-adenosylhomocysteine deaminase
MAAIPGDEAACAERYDGRDRLLLPALANSHSHLAMTLLRNQADDLPLQRWLFESIFPREALLTPDIVASGSRLALAEMIKSGTGAVADMYYHHEETAAAALAAGFRLNFAVDAKRDGPRGQTVDDAVLAAAAALTRHPSGLLRASLLVHSIYLYQPDVYAALADAAVRTGFPVHVHIGETNREVADCLDRYGVRPTVRLAQWGFFATPTVVAHGVHLDAAERSILAAGPVLLAHCPASNLKLGSGIADLSALEQAGVTCGIGTDGAASNNNLDLYRDLRLASYLAKGRSGDAAALPAGRTLRMATANGMRGLGFADSGRIEATWQADLQIVRTDSPGLTPLGDPVAALVYSAAGSDVESLMIAGRWLMRRRELLTLDEEKIRHDANQAARKLTPA